MFNVFRATEQACTVTTNTPTDNASNIEVNIGIVMQYHYVGLDTTGPTVGSHSNSPTDASGNSHDTVFDTPLDDTTIEQGDEHTKQITGGPQSSVMSVGLFSNFLCSTC